MFAQKYKLKIISTQRFEDCEEAKKSLKFFAYLFPLREKIIAADTTNIFL